MWAGTYLIAAYCFLMSLGIKLAFVVITHQFDFAPACEIAYARYCQFGVSALFGHRFTVGSISANSFRVSIKKMPQPRSFCESRESAKSASEPSALLITHYSVEPTSR